MGPRSPSDSPPRRNVRKPQSPSDSPPRRRRSSSNSPSKRKNRSSSNSPPRKKAGLDLGRNYRKKSPVTSRGKSPIKHQSTNAATAEKKVLSDAEKQAKLAEMMANATWRD